MRKLTTVRAASSTPSRGAKPSPPDRRTEERILDAAHTVFVRRGTAGARMQDIAKEAGVNQALLHYYFRSKERLSEAVFRRAATQLFPRVFEVMASDAALEEKVARVVELELEHLARAPYLPGYIISELTHQPERAKQLMATMTGLNPEKVGPTIVATLRKQIDASVRAGTMRQINPEQFLVNLISLCIFPFAARPMLMAVLGMDGQGFEQFTDRRRRDLAAFFLKALRP
jgi:TetR/AcrR family transcriptional regulator